MRYNPINYFTTSASPRRWWKWLLISALGALVLVLLAGALMIFAIMRAFDTTPKITESLPASKIESIGHFKLPPSAAHIRSNYGVSDDFHLYVCFTIAPQDLRVLLSSTQIRSPLYSDRMHVPAVLGSGGPPWWFKQLPARFETADFSSISTTAPVTQPTVFQEILIDETSPQEYVVWFCAYGG